MKTRRLTEFFVLGIAAMLVTACINGNPGSAGNSAVSKNTPASNVTVTDNNTPENGSAVEETGVYPTTSKPVVNVYLEISGSMNGYVNGGTSTFQQVVKELGMTEAT